MGYWFIQHLFLKKNMPDLAISHCSRQKLTNTIA